jgi:PilZ domain
VYYGAAHNRPMEEKHRRTPRFPFIAPAEVIEGNAASGIPTRLKELSLYGCYLELTTPIPRGTAITVKILIDGDFFEAAATVVYMHASLGMGLAFRDVKPHFLTVLRRWLRSAIPERFPSEQQADTPDKEA